MRKAPSPSKISVKKLDDIMVYDTIGAERYSKKGRINKVREASEVICNRNRQKLDDYYEYRLWYKSLTSPQREALAKSLGW